MTKKLTNILRNHCLSAIGRPIDLKCEQRMSIQHLLLGKDVIAILSTGFGKKITPLPRNLRQSIHSKYRAIFTVYALAKVSWEGSYFAHHDRKIQNIIKLDIF